MLAHRGVAMLRSLEAFHETARLSTRVSAAHLRYCQQRRRALHISVPRPQAGPTKLTNILDGSPAPAVQVRRISEEGVELLDGRVLPGACVFLDGQVFLWDVPSVGFGGGGTRPSNAMKVAGLGGWRKEDFVLFEVVVPKPEILLLGTGRGVVHPPPSIREYLNGLGIQLDVMDTWNACTTYNLLAEEGRRVAAALLPVPGARSKR